MAIYPLGPWSCVPEGEGTKRCQDAPYSCPEGAFSSDSGLPQLGGSLWGPGVTLLSCDRLTLERDWEAVRDAPSPCHPTAA